jgi:hypothetical protein
MQWRPSARGTSDLLGDVTRNLVARVQHGFFDSPKDVQRVNQITSSTTNYICRLIARLMDKAQLLNRLSRLRKLMLVL